MMDWGEWLLALFCFTVIACMGRHLEETDIGIGEEKSRDDAQQVVAVERSELLLRKEWQRAQEEASAPQTWSADLFDFMCYLFFFIFHLSFFISLRPFTFFFSLWSVKVSCYSF